LKGRPLLTLPKFTVELPAGKPKMAIIHGTDVPTMVRAAVGELGGFEHFIKRGDIVVVKPNVAFDRAPILGATTNPEVLSQSSRIARKPARARWSFATTRSILRRALSTNPEYAMPHTRRERNSFCPTRTRSRCSQ